MSDLNWTTEKRKLSDLKEIDYNPRTLSKKQYGDLKSSLSKFNLAEIPAINKDNSIIAGHQRCRVLQELKGKDAEIEVRVPSRQLSKEESDEYLVRSNKNVGDWDYDILANNFEVESLIEWGFTDDELMGVVDEESLEVDGGDIPENQKLTFTLSDEQANLIKSKLDDIKNTDNFKYVETFGNTDPEGNALYLFFTQKK